MEPWDNLAHQIALLCLDPRSGRVRRRTDLALATAGGALAELAIQERVSLQERKVRVHDIRPTEDPLLDVMLRVLADQPDRRPRRILEAARKTYLNQALAEMVTHGWVNLKPTAGLGRDRYEVTDVERLERIRALARQGYADPDRASTRAACLAGLAHEVGLGRELAPDLSFWQRYQVARRLRAKDWVVKAVYDVRAARQAAASSGGS